MTTEPATPQPDPFDLRSHDVADDKRAELLRLFPEAHTEGGHIDYDQLRRALGDVIDPGRERYGMVWPGKADCFKAIQQPSLGTLLPDRGESVDFDTTENLIIEGDNLEVLKLLQKSYLGKVKMIYIDPPYNTGNDFIYPDDYAESLNNYLRLTGQVDVEGRRLSTNTEKEGRFHSNWLNIMYPRLYLARNLSRDDGVILVSIDDTELDNLRKGCSEIFGEENFVEQIIWRKRSTPPNDKVIGANHDYIVIFAKNIDQVGLTLRERSQDRLAAYKNRDDHAKGPWATGDLQANVKGGRYVSSLNFPIRNPTTGEEHFPSANGNWRFNRDRVAELLANNEIHFGADGRGRPKLKRFLKDVKEGSTYPTIWDFVPLNNDGSLEMEELFGDAAIFENPKPTGLVKELLKLGSGADGLILDFFAGSGSTAHAVLDLNNEGGGSRKFILVQLPEPCEPDSAAAKAGYPTIAKLCAERVRRVTKRLNDEDAGQQQDRGFRVFKLAESNFLAWNADIRQNDVATLEKQLKLHVDHVRDGRTAEDRLYELLLKSGFPLTTPVEALTIEGKAVYSIAESEMLTCLDKNLTLEAMRAMAARKPSRVVCLDEGFAANDQLKTNSVQTFKDKGVQFHTV